MCLPGEVLISNDGATILSSLGQLVVNELPLYATARLVDDHGQPI